MAGKARKEYVCVYCARKGRRWVFRSQLALSTHIMTVHRGGR